MSRNYFIFQCPKCGGCGFHLAPEPTGRAEAIIGAPCNTCATVMTDEEFKRQHCEFSIGAVKENYQSVSVYSIEYCKEGAILRGGPLRGSLEQTLVIARAGLVRRSAEFANIIDAGTGAEVASVRRRNG